MTDTLPIRPTSKETHRQPSLLFPAELTAIELADRPPDAFADLNLDQIVASLTAKREPYDLAPYLWTPLPTVAAVRYRQAVFDDLADDQLRHGLEEFAEAMRVMRRWQSAAEKTSYRRYGQGCRLEAIHRYLTALASLRELLQQVGPRSNALKSIMEYLDEYVASERFVELGKDNRRLQNELASLHYAVRIRGPKVTVTSERSDQDFSKVVTATFERFQQSDVDSHLIKLGPPSFTHVDEQILGCLAKLNADLFGRLAEHCRRHATFIDAVISRFDRELQVCLGYLAITDPLRAAGLRFALPEFTDPPALDVRSGFDLALGLNIDPGRLVCNDATLEGDERALVLSGPNQGGKTTFARMVGQVFYLAGLGFPVPASHARLHLMDRIFTHFERVEDRDRDTEGGKLEDDVIRIRDILQQSTGRSVLVINEMFSSTTIDDAQYLGGAVLAKIGRSDTITVYVTFVEELASAPGAVSMVSRTLPEDPAVRTFHVDRMPPQGTAHALALAAKHRLTRAEIVRRLSRPAQPEPSPRQESTAPSRGAEA
ncbi:DNA mismatch repair protein MutS [Microlunatus elymi]|uniref:DNA mismatch repair protein MutS n=1 Tax=Microlunatus elymi TaxID=2596828 RepID=A0A516PXV4_9ACTN|nr:DNA mismatch repair protein MutS [Microlunatus elymi]QDP95993.1 DNA mismatch repair protein MutS [Microlunatus elymi]